MIETDIKLRNSKQSQEGTVQDASINCSFFKSPEYTGNTPET